MGAALAVVFCLVALTLHQRHLPAWYGVLIGGDNVLALLALGLSLGSLQANRERRFLAAIGIVTSGIVLLLAFGLMIIERGNYWT